MDMYLFMDLDDTVFQTRRKCLRDSGLLPAALGREGKPISFMTPAQRAFFSLLDARMAVIPTTARNLESFNRVQMQFNHCVILDFGGVILNPERKVDKRWLARMEAESRKARSLILEAYGAVADIIRREKLTSTVRIIGDLGLDFYVLIKNLDKRVGDLNVIRQHVSERYGGGESYLHFNDNNLCILPSYLDKSKGVAFVVENYIAPLGRDYMTFGMGDSNTDLEFMKLCDFLIVPGSSQIRRGRLDYG